MSEAKALRDASLGSVCVTQGLEHAPLLLGPPALRGWSGAGPVVGGCYSNLTLTGCALTLKSPWGGSGGKSAPLLPHGAASISGLV